MQHSLNYGRSRTDLSCRSASTYCTNSVTGRCQAPKNLADVARSRRLTIESLYRLFGMPQRLAARCGVSTSRT